ncbi:MULTISPECIES: SanA/YdcF family protein [Tenacibaculum]|uniref:SanA/YdcF family protein n=1 Tax=Tenacibaculum TaxID=104267 RepID=UPI00089D18DA|nr:MULTISPECIES: ElyC/SanA/YdcF family protein [unclassified Tenacibaculum]RBW62941.1 vancomycin high temperature exclusion protein [Tenacibaculum sp. E3R01]SEE66813.1 SanA protein [Tenacibaculum sp. MAR_2010_89]
MKKKKIIGVLLVFIIPFMLVFVANYSIEKNAVNKTFTDSNEIKKNKVGLVLGTAKILNNGRINLYFKYRIQATVALYKKGKIDFVLVSGDNGNKNYDEPTDFKNELIKKGIPANRIFLDYAGFRTLDSVVRAKEIFGQTSVTIISQKFHNERAIFLAEKNGINAIGFNARDLTGKYGLKVRIREYFARTKAFLDIMFGVEPKFLGEKVEIK